MITDTKGLFIQCLRMLVFSFFKISIAIGIGIDLGNPGDIAD
jgi:hypothetical protein